MQTSTIQKQHPSHNHNFRPNNNYAEFQNECYDQEVVKDFSENFEYHDENNPDNDEQINLDSSPQEYSYYPDPDEDFDSNEDEENFP